MGKRLEQTLQTKENLKTAFWSLYSQKPLDQITVREVTELAGYNRGTFYVYFKDVYDLLDQAEEEILSVFQNRRNFRFEPYSKEHFAEMIRFFIQFIEQYEQRLLLLAGEQGDPKFLHCLLECIHHSLSDRLRPYVVLDDKTFSYLVNALISAQSTVVMHWVRSGKDISEEQLIDLLYCISCQGPLAIIFGPDRSDPKDQNLRLS